MTEEVRAIFLELHTAIYPVSSWQFIKTKGSAIASVSHYANREGSNKKKKINRTLFARGDKADDCSRFMRALIQQRRRTESTAAPLSVHKAGDVFTYR